MGTAQIQGELWSARADEWADLQEGSFRQLYEAAFKTAKVGTDSLVLDVGCGAGLALQVAHEFGAKVSGIDAAPDLAKIAQRRCPDGDIRVGEIEELPYRDGSFDVTTGFNSFQYAANPVKALREAKRVTKPGGAVVVAVWGAAEKCQLAPYLAAVGKLMPPPPPGAPGPFALSAPGALERLVGEAGLKPAASAGVITTMRDGVARPARLRCRRTRHPQFRRSRRAQRHRPGDPARAPGGWLIRVQQRMAVPGLAGIGTYRPCPPVVIRSCVGDAPAFTKGLELAADEFTVGVRLTDEQRLDWLRLIRSDNVGPRTFRALLNHCGGDRAALDALPDLARRGGASSPARICSRETAERELAGSQRLGVALVALGEPEYPARLRMIDDPPPLVGIRDKIAALSSNMIALVGSRNASAAGVKFAERIAHELGAAGFIIVSGLARGIDAAAHRASVATGTVAVLAGGHDHIYPAEHEPLLQSILPNGAAITEMPLGWEPRGRDFPRRNRLISGLALGVIIVEAAQRSGSLITARMALEQGREVFAVPGSPLDPRAEGTNGLLKQGATLVTEAADVLAVVRPILGQHVAQPAQEPDNAPPGPSGPQATNVPRSLARSVQRLSRSTIWSGCRNHRPRSCARCCWNSKSPVGWSAMAAASFRWCKLRG